MEEEAGDGEGDGEGDELASFSRSFLIFMIALTGGGAKWEAGELEHPACKATAIAKDAVCETFKELRDFMKIAFKMTI